MSKKEEFDYMGIKGVVDHRPFVVPGQIAWMQSCMSDVYLRFLCDFPGVEGIQGIAKKSEEMPVAYYVGDELMQVKREFNMITFNFSLEAISGYFTNDVGIGCMMRFGGKARSVFIPYAAMVSLYDPKGSQLHGLLGYDIFASRRLITHITPGMQLAMNSPSPAETAAPAQDQPKSETPKERPSHLRRVQ